MSAPKDSAASAVDPLWTFLEGLDRAELVDLLVELAHTEDFVLQRLERRRLAADPSQLAADFKRTLQGWKRSHRFIAYQEAHAFAASLQEWLDQIERELLPVQPALALELYEAFIGSDRHFFEGADDSDGVIGDAIRSACSLWLRAAKSSATETDWIERVYDLASGDEYGAREPLLQQANILLDEPALRALAGRFERELDFAIETAGAADELRHRVFKASAAIGLLAEALRDPDLSVKAVLSYSPEPNELQQARFAEDYIRFGRPGDALRWLEGDWGRREDERLRLLSAAHEALGNTDKVMTIRETLFKSTGEVEDFRAWDALLPEELRPAAEEIARAQAKRSHDPISAARLLLAIKANQEAEQLLVERCDEIRGEDYPRLVPLAETLEEQRNLLGCVACYRALLLAILGRGYARAYSHGARYLAKLRELSPQIRDHAPLAGPEEFEAKLYAAHRRKASFWKLVDQR
jgi:hypothetical protein